MNSIYPAICNWLEKKSIGLDRDSNPWPQKYRSCTLPLSFLTTCQLSSRYIRKYLYPAAYTLQRQNSFQNSGSVLINHSQQHSLSFSPRFCEIGCNRTADWLNHKPYGLVNRKLCYIQMLLNIEKSG